jgi:GNAT superfamily N-acetyltransferase
VIFAALTEAADRGELLLVQGGLCRWHRRRDGVVTIREILVLPSHRGQGIGRSLVDLVRQRNPGSLVRAVCPVKLSANGFWRHLGFTATTKGQGGAEKWELSA